MFIKNNQGVYVFEELQKFPLIHGVSTKSYGNMSYVHGSKAEVDSNRKKFSGALGIDLSKTAQASLVHGTKVVIANEPKLYEDIDGLITNKPGLALWIMTGDCAPIILYDPVQKVLGLLHSGWKGTVGKISVVAISKMLTDFNSKIGDIVVAIGPSIEKCCYLNPTPNVQENLPEWSNFIKNLDVKNALIDLNGFTINQLTEIGIKKDNIFWANYCTKDHSNEFFCSQEETAGETVPGRFATVVQMT